LHPGPLSPRAANSQKVICCTLKAIDSYGGTVIF
jgi:hypothetical protein